MKNISLCLTASFFLALPASAAISFIIDPTGKTITFTGSDIGTPESFEDYHFANWQSGSTTGSPQYLSLTSAFSGLDISYSNLVVYPLSADGLYIEIVWTTSGSKIFSGNGIPVSYAALNPASQSILESTTFFSPASGLGLSSFESVPEPSAFVMMLISSSGLFLRRNRRA